MALNIVAVIIGYLLGSIPFAYIVARMKKGVDIRDVGGGNVGALNTYREIGPVFGLSVLALDIIKGVLAVMVARWLGLSVEWLCITGFAAVVGHNWPVFIKFRGGKGAATVLGVLVALTPVELLIAAAIVIILIGITRNVRLALFALILTPVLQWVFDKDMVYIYCALALLLFIGIRTLIDLRIEIAKKGKQNLFIDREYTRWQTRKTE
ncbi:MAG: glycerol-3-phosphate 1-O-acyltransferase PlsY [Dehalococcoidales bacterium]|nr:glycerol-3-phosphate 1-O-acyltransferase PlsY [Dehalococcoidales bacterium]